MPTEQDIFQRTELLLGRQAMEAIGRSRVILFGVGGVGSWCAESLVRSGVKRLTMVDHDLVCASNINRQLMATTQTIGRPKVEVLRERLLQINPEAEIIARQETYSEASAADFHLEDYDYVIDAIDSLQDKCHLILHACRAGVRLFSSMGAALKMDPQAIRVGEFWQVKGCPLARAIRQRFRRERTFPARKFRCVYSEELLTNRGTVTEENGRRPNGTLCHATAIFGLTLAGLVVQDITQEE